MTGGGSGASNPRQVIERLKLAYGADTLGQLAHLMKLPDATVKAWSQRQSVPLDKLIQAARECNCSLDWLCGLTDDPRARS